MTARPFAVRDASGTWNTGSAEIPPDARLYVFSDGAFEIVDAEGRDLGILDLRRIIAGPEGTDALRVWQMVRASARPGPLDSTPVLECRF